VAVLHHPDPSERAAEANEFGGDVYLGITLDPEPCCRPAYFAVPGFTSVGGERLAVLIAEEVPRVLEVGDAAPQGTRLAILRETRMPAVTCRVGPPELVVAQAPALAAALTRAIERWVEEPVEGA
jgi:N-acetylmuramoyl-L-alanine amidase